MTSDITLNRNGLRVGGKYRALLCASFFYFRMPREEWRDRAHRLKETGYTCADVYFPWNFHETAPGAWRFDGEADASAFLDILADEGLLVMARPGPYICSEWDGGGIPAWVLAADSPIRQAEGPYMQAVENWYRRILPIIAAHEYGRGGSVILLQVENELDFFDCPDPAAYMRRLAELTRENGITVPVTGCAGQGGVARATGLCPGIVPTFNFYPNSSDPAFDKVAGAANRLAASQNLPLLISETGGDHFLLRRELAAGAKLMGAYNQAAGYDFDFTNSINNWGPGRTPLSLQTCEYGSDKMISPYGEYTRHAREGRLFAAFLETFGEKAAAATAEESEEWSLTVGDGPARRPGVLRNAAGETFVCAANFEDRAARAVLTCGGSRLSVSATVPAHTAPFWCFHVALEGVCPGLLLLSSSAEIIGARPGRLLCYGEPDAALTLRLPDGRTVRVAGHGTHTLACGGGELHVRIIRREEALAELLPSGGKPAGGRPAAVSLTHAAKSAAALCDKQLPAGPSLYFEPNGIYRGFAQYRARVPRGQAVVVTDAADFISAYDGGRFLDTRISGGTAQLYPAAQEENWLFRVESWGHSNFDDSRLPALRLQSKKGIGGVYSVLKTEESLLWRFALAENWLPEKLEIAESPFDPILPPDAWNSTRMPLLAAYSTCFAPQKEADAFALSLAGNEAETALYVNGVLAGVFNSYAPRLDFTRLVDRQKPCRLTLLCRKRDWAQPVGTPVVWELQKCPATLSVPSKGAFARLSAAGGTDVTLPFRLAPGETAVLEFDLDGIQHVLGHGRANLADMKATVVFNGRVVGRPVGPFAGMPTLCGGDPLAFCLPQSWFRAAGNRLSLLLEGIGAHPLLSSLELLPVADSF